MYSKLSQLCHPIIQEISEFSIGQWLSCCNPNCGELISFTSEEIAQTCWNCNTKLRYHYCELHRHVLTIRSPILHATYCSECERQICPDVMVKCVICEGLVCAECIHDNNTCDFCVSMLNVKR